MLDDQTLEDLAARKRALDEAAASDNTSAMLGDDAPPPAPGGPSEDQIRAMYTPGTPVHSPPLSVPQQSESAPAPTQNQPFPMPPQSPAPHVIRARADDSEAPPEDYRADPFRVFTALGLGDVGAYDERKRRAKMAPLEFQAKKREEETAKEQQRLARARLDPMSQESNRAQSEFTSQLKAYSQIPGIPQGIKDEMTTLGASSSKMSATEIDRRQAMMKTLLGSVLRGASIEGVSDRATKGFEIRSRDMEQKAKEHAQRLGLNWSELNEMQRHHMATEAQASEARADVTVRKPQEKLNQDISGLEVARQQMMQLAKLKPGVNTGPIVQWFRTKLGADKMDELTSGDRVDVRALAARIFNKETKTLAGTAVTDSEWQRIAPQIPEVSDDDDVFMQKLERALQETERILAERRKEYQIKFGAPIDASRTASEAVAKTHATPATPQPSAKINLAKRALADPNAPDDVKKQARKVLDAAGIK